MPADNVKLKPVTGIANQGAGNDNRIIKFDANGDPVVVEGSVIGSQNDDLINFHIPFPQQQKYILLNFWDKSGSVINASALSIGGNTVWDLEKMAAGTGIGSPTNITGMGATATGTSRGSGSLEVAPTDGTEDFLVAEGLIVDLTSVGGLVTDFIITVKVIRP